MEGEMKYVSAESLECPMCMNIFKEPKILSCSHTFCKVCLERLLEWHVNEQLIKCPVCRGVTQLPRRDVRQLQTNLILQSLLENMTQEFKFCTDCKAKGKNENAKVSCQDCGTYLCLDCKKTHDSIGFSDHEVLPMNEVSSEEAPSQQRRKCRKHPNEGDQCFCCDCSKYVCLKCGVKEHVYKGHHIIDASEQECNRRKIVKELKSKAYMKQSALRKYIDTIDKQKEQTSKVRNQYIHDINQAYEESVRQLSERKELLVEEVTEKIEKIETELGSLRETAQQQTSRVTTMTDLVSNKNQVLLENEALAAHVTLCEDLQGVLGQKNPDCEYPVKLTRKGKKIAYYKDARLNELGFGQFLKRRTGSSMTDAMNDMAATPDGMMAVVCKSGVIKIFTPGGQLQQTVLLGIDVWGLRFLSDGSYLVLNLSGVVTLFTPGCEKLNVKFDTTGDSSASEGLAVTTGDEICIANLETKKIEVFSRAGGKAIREMSCGRFEPYQITSCGHSESFIITDLEKVRYVDRRGQVKHMESYSNYSCCVAGTHRNDVLIAWVDDDEGLVTIKEYTKELKYIQTLISNYKFEQSEGSWYCLQEFISGEIAFCTSDRLYIFKHTVICSCL